MLNNHKWNRFQTLRDLSKVKHSLADKEGNVPYGDENILLIDHSPLKSSYYKDNTLIVPNMDSAALENYNNAHYISNHLD